MLRAVPDTRSSATVAVDVACARARDAATAFAGSDLGSRATLLRRLRGALLKDAEAIIALLMEDSGKVRFEAISLELVPAALALTYNAHAAPRVLSSRTARPFLPLPRRATTHHTPRGVLGLITPYNYTLSIPMATLAAGVAAGNAIVWKPAESGTRVAEHVVALFEDAGMPRGLITVVEGGVETGRALVDSAIDHLTFVGSTGAGRTIAARCGERLLPCVLELGGNAPAIVLEGADLDRASRGIVYGGLANAGQSCVAVERVYAPPAIFGELLDRTAALAARIRPGVDVARVLPSQDKKVQAWIGDARARGAVFHGDIVVDVTHMVQALPRREDSEIFGPLLPFTRVASVDDAVDRANASAQQLCAYVFGPSTEARAVARRLKAPHAVINDAMISYAMMELPFGGEDASGSGRTHGPAGLLALSREQIVVDDTFLGVLPLRKEPWWLPYDDAIGERLLRGLERALAWRDRLPF